MAKPAYWRAWRCRLAGPVGLLGAMTLAMAGFTTYVYSRELPPNPRIDLVNAIGALVALPPWGCHLLTLR